MQELDLSVLFAVALEVLGAAFWILLLLALAAVGTFAVTLWRERTLSARRLVLSEGLGLIGSLLALWVVARFTLSGFTDAGGPIDWILVGAIWFAGLLGTTMLSYGVLGLLGQRKAR